MENSDQDSCSPTCFILNIINHKIDVEKAFRSFLFIKEEA